jgi:DNA-3-methyladenine glycosylase
MITRLGRSFFARSPVLVARELLGKNLHFRGKVARIVETEAYLGSEDLASHARFVSRKRNHLMFGTPGVAYVYFTYGMYYMLNIVADEEGKAGAVLIRAVEPLVGVDLATNGPGRLTKALGITLLENGIDLVGRGDFYLEDGEGANEIVESTRIGIDYAEEYKDKPWRFYVKESRFVSRV